MDFIGIILTFLSTALITISRVISDSQRAMRNYLVYVGLLVSCGAVFVTYHNVQGQKEKLRMSIDKSEKFEGEVKELKMKMFALNGQIEETTTSLLRSNDASSIAIAEKLKNTTGQLLSANYSTSSVVNDLLKEQNDSLRRILVHTVTVLRQSIAASENNLKSQIKESEGAIKNQFTTAESSLKIGLNNLEDHIDDHFEKTNKMIDGIEADSTEEEE